MESLPKPDNVAGPGHRRSESSSDSFVCVSESATNEGERGLLEQETWEVVDGGSSPQSQSSPKQSKEDFDIDDLLEEDTAEVTDEADKTLEDSNSSDWEDWNDWVDMQLRIEYRI